MKWVINNSCDALDMKLANPRSTMLTEKVISKGEADLDKVFVLSASLQDCTLQSDDYRY